MPQHDRLPVRRSRCDDTPARRRRHRFYDELDDHDEGPGQHTDAPLIRYHRTMARLPGPLLHLGRRRARPRTAAD